MSLREGIVLDYIARHRKEIAHAERYPDVRRRSVIELAERCNYIPEHAQRIASLALALFDATRGIHGLTDRERAWLEYAALLHDIGVHISYERHHKHSYYLIRNGDLRGFEPADIVMIALIARYHRRAVPVRGHEGFADLTKKRRRIVHTLGAILRLVETLDRSHSQVVTGLAFEDRGDDALLTLHVTGDSELELWAASRHASPFEGIIGKPLRIAALQRADVRRDNVANPDQAGSLRGPRGEALGTNPGALGNAGDLPQQGGASRIGHRMALVAPAQVQPAPLTKAAPVAAAAHRTVARRRVRR